MLKLYFINKPRHNQYKASDTVQTLKVEIPARPYLKLTDDDFNEILDATKQYLK